MKRFALCLAVWVALSCSSRAAEVIPPKPAGYFNDYANVVSQSVVRQFNEQLAQFERETSVQIVITVFQKMETDSSIDDYTRRIAKAWDIGQKETKNGAALFVFVQDHKMFIQTAHGLEGALPDATCFDITHNLIAPYFKKNDYPGGLSAGIEAMMQAVRGEYKGVGKTSREREGASNGKFPFPLLFFFFVIVFFFIIPRFSRKRGYRYSGFGGPFIGGWSGSSGGGWSSGGSSGGGFSGFSGGGGGGGFGGGGAGSSW